MYTDWHHPGDRESIIESKSFWALGNFSRFIRPGFVRVELIGDHHSFDGLIGSVYANPKTGQLVLVYVNLASESQKVTWNIKDGKFKLPEQFVPWTTTSVDDLKENPPINPGDGFVIPSRSIVTFVGNSAD